MRRIGLQWTFRPLSRRCSFLLAYRLRLADRPGDADRKAHCLAARIGPRRGGWQQRLARAERLFDGGLHAEALDVLDDLSVLREQMPADEALRFALVWAQVIEREESLDAALSCTATGTTWITAVCS